MKPPHDRTIHKGSYANRFIRPCMKPP